MLLLLLILLLPSSTNHKLKVEGEKRDWILFLEHVGVGKCMQDPLPLVACLGTANSNAMIDRWWAGKCLPFLVPVSDVCAAAVLNCTWSTVLRQCFRYFGGGNSVGF